MFHVIRDIPSPIELKTAHPLPAHLAKVKADRDLQILRIFTGEDTRFLLIIGPCSADNENAVCDYVSRLAKVQEEVAEKILVIPRIYTNKPRTNGQGYKGMLHQPDPHSAPDIYAGIQAIRRLQLRAISESHLTAADEMLYPENVTYFDDLLSYHAVGARSVENQSHRLASSGIDAPVGMKNPTSGDLMVMFNSIMAAQSDHTFMYREQEVRTTGNPLAHAILRGSVNRHSESIPNYHFEDLRKTASIYENSGLINPAIVVDVNHSNSNKFHFEQPRIAKEIMHSMGYDSSLKRMIKGLMIESYLEEGRQDPDGTVYGKSITDACLGWEDSRRLIHEIAGKL